MGSNQSTSGGNSDPSPAPVLGSPTPLEPSGNAESTIAGGDSAPKKPKPKQAKRSIDSKCRKQKRAWGRCVADHYEKKFLPGKSLEPEEDCDDLFDKFRDCYLKNMLKQRQEKGLLPPKKDSALHEYMDEEGMLDDKTESP